MKTPEEIKNTIIDCTTLQVCKRFECPYIDSNDCNGDLMRDALAYIEQLEAVQPKWIRVKDRLPDAYCEVLILLHGKCVNMAWHHGNGVFELPSGIRFHAKKDDKALTHWMPLPEPPKEV